RLRIVVQARNAYDDFIRTFGNVLFAVTLFLAWGVLTLIGVIVDQGKDAATYLASYPAPIARAIVRLGFDNIYHSPWYVGIVALILTSLAVCTFKRVIPARLPPLRPVKVEKIPLNASAAVPGSEADVRARVEAFFRTRGWHIRNRAFDGIEWSFADKFNWARRGVLIAHLGFVIIAAGTTVYWARGFSGDAAVVTGQSVEIPKTRAVIKLDNFAYRISPILTKSGMVYQPVDYVSHVTVTGNDGVPKPMTVRVNQPIDIDGTLYYQASYGFAMRFTVTHNGKRDAALSDRVLAEGERLELPGTRSSVSFDRFVPTVDRQTGMPAADPRVNDPAVVLSVSQAGATAGSALVPLHTWIDAGGGWRIVPQNYVLYSGFQYRYDPGIPLVGIGAIVLLAGLIVSFYFLPARLYVRIDESAGVCSVGVAATTVKGYDIFERQFGELVEDLLQALEPPGPRTGFSPAEAF
ncbi:MAG: cytochrome c biogenesis protein ResB, partial [Candidatus Eremiobacteraeota bacterium]|nr:cytochrome c biogenesis protein ResB [Candidatus Eremiobacteraeota bacterium]